MLLELAQAMYVGSGVHSSGHTFVVYVIMRRIEDINLIYNAAAGEWMYGGQKARDPYTRLYAAHFNAALALQTSYRSCKGSAHQHLKCARHPPAALCTNQALYGQPHTTNS